MSTKKKRWFANGKKIHGRIAVVDREEDAPVVAAAPDLLAAAYAALVELYRVSPSRAAPLLRAAIAKAEGCVT